MKNLKVFIDPNLLLSIQHEDDWYLDKGNESLEFRLCLISTNYEFGFSNNNSTYELSAFNNGKLVGSMRTFKAHGMAMIQTDDEFLKKCFFNTMQTCVLISNLFANNIEEVKAIDPQKTGVLAVAEDDQFNLIDKPLDEIQ